MTLTFWPRPRAGLYVTFLYTSLDILVVACSSAVATETLSEQLVCEQAPPVLLQTHGGFESDHTALLDDQKVVDLSDGKVVEGAWLGKEAVKQLYTVAELEKRVSSGEVQARPSTRNLFETEFRIVPKAERCKGADCIGAPALAAKPKALLHAVEEITGQRVSHNDEVQHGRAKSADSALSKSHEYPQRHHHEHSQQHHEFARDPPHDSTCGTPVPFDLQNNQHMPLTLGGLVEAMWEDPGRLGGALLATCRKLHEDDRPLDWCYDESKMPSSVSQWSGECVPDVSRGALPSTNWTMHQQSTCEKLNPHGTGSKLAFVMVAHVARIGQLRNVALAVQGRLQIYPDSIVVIVDNGSPEEFHSAMVQELAPYGKSVTLISNPDRDAHPYELGGYYQGIQVLERLGLPPDSTVIFTQANLLLVKPLPPLELMQDDGCDVTPVFSGWGDTETTVIEDKAEWNARPWPELDRKCPGGRDAFWNMARAFDRAGRKHIWGSRWARNPLHVAFVSKVSFAVRVLKPVLQAAPSCDAKIGEVVSSLLVVGGSADGESVQKCIQGFDVSHEGDGMWDSLGYYFLKVHPHDDNYHHTFWQSVMQVFYEADPRRRGVVSWESFVDTRSGSMAKEFCQDVMSKPLFTTATWWAKYWGGLREYCSANVGAWECFSLSPDCLDHTGSASAEFEPGDVSSFAQSWSPISCNMLRQLGGG